MLLLLKGKKTKVRQQFFSVFLAAKQFELWKK